MEKCSDRLMMVGLDQARIWEAPCGKYSGQSAGEKLGASGPRACCFARSGGCSHSAPVFATELARTISVSFNRKWRRICIKQNFGRTLQPEDLWCGRHSTAVIPGARILGPIVVWHICSKHVIIDDKLPRSIQNAPKSRIKHTIYFLFTPQRLS